MVQLDIRPSEQSLSPLLIRTIKNHHTSYARYVCRIHYHWAIEHVKPNKSSFVALSRISIVAKQEHDHATAPSFRLIRFLRTSVHSERVPFRTAFCLSLPFLALLALLARAAVAVASVWTLPERSRRNGLRRTTYGIISPRAQRAPRTSTAH